MVKSQNRKSNSGQAVGLLIIALTLVMAVAFGLVALSARQLHRARAQTAADAAALAGALGGYAEAQRAAELNGGRLRRFIVSDRGAVHAVSVTVEVADQLAVAAASDEP